MWTRIRRLAVAAVLLTLPVSGAAQTRPVDTADIVHRLEAEVEKILAETGIPSIAIALVRDGDVVWSDAFGYGNVAAKARATADT